MDKQNKPVQCRVLLDTCSTANFMMESLATSLGLPKTKYSIPVGALNALETGTKNIVEAVIQSMDGRFRKSLTFLTVPKISDGAPSENISRNSVAIPPNLKMADPEFFRSAPVQLLLGAGPTLSLFCIGQYVLSAEDDLILQKTKLGWVIGGAVPPRPEHKHSNYACHHAGVNFDLASFWRLDEIEPSPHFSPQEVAAEAYFVKNTTRSDNGRYTVRLPFNERLGELGDSRTGALKRFYAIEKRFAQNAPFKEAYSAVINEYLELGHMSPIDQADSHSGYYLPHQAVIKEGSLTTKLRVVFDASAKTSSGVCLNDTLLVGPTLQQPMLNTLLQFRQHQFVVTGDIEKMYRQFDVHTEDRRFQKLFWRDAKGEVATYQLNTVTFGTACGAYLAIRCLMQLAHDEGHRYPRAASIIKTNMYVDDVLTGGPTVEAVKGMRQELTQLLKCANLHLRQWASNDSRILEGLPPESINQKIYLDATQSLKTLGVSWKSKEDAIVYNVNPISAKKKTTKRLILSEIAKIFDPLGLLGPVILAAKMIIQTLWQEKLHWDESVPHGLYTRWAEFSEELKQLNNVSFPRKVIISEPESVQLHIFCDASESGYGACAYIRSTDRNLRSCSRLLCSRSRVAPLKTLTIPRLELCAAQLGADVYVLIKTSLNLQLDRVVMWSDSMIVLHWIKTSPHILKTFVAHRVAGIQTKTANCEWRHVESRDNPADGLSRGQSPNTFLNNVLWQVGPPWLTQSEDAWPDTKLATLPEIPEAKKINICLRTTTQVPPSIVAVLERYSSIHKLRRIIAYCHRIIIYALRRKWTNECLQVGELQKANDAIIRLQQRVAFPQEYRDLLMGREVNRNSPLLLLKPFLGPDGVMRVGGRLRNAEKFVTTRNPMILPKNCPVTRLIIDEAHRSHLHAGSLATLCAVQRRYWVMSGRGQVRKMIRSCLRCLRVAPPSVDYVMGDLPRERVNKSSPFTHVGVDYCGPFHVKEKKVRNRKSVKVYVAVFVCLAVKAVHLEVVSDLTTDAFIEALWRFIARRGKPETIHSDNSTTFHGAHNQMKEVMNLIKSQEHNCLVHSKLAQEGIIWKFIPPLSPHFGGLWEAAVKSFKHHLKRVVGSELFTFEEFNTLIVQIEAVLNSRPLTEPSTDPTDLNPLTPAHFLVHRALTSLPEQNLSEIPQMRLGRRERIQQIRRNFWARWHHEYINQLNIRRKWKTGVHGIKEGTVVLLKEENAPPMQWRMGRVLKTHPGSDGVVRVITVKTNSGVLDRNVRRVAPLFDV